MCPYTCIYTLIHTRVQRTKTSFIASTNTSNRRSCIQTRTYRRVCVSPVYVGTREETYSPCLCVCIQVSTYSLVHGNLSLPSRWEKQLAYGGRDKCMYRPRVLEAERNSPKRTKRLTAICSRRREYTRTHRYMHADSLTLSCVGCTSMQESVGQSTGVKMQVPSRSGGEVLSLHVERADC